MSGKLLWCQEKVAAGEFEVRQVGTVRNVADIGTKPLSQHRLRLLLYWLQARDGEGGRVGQREFEQFNEQHIEKGKVMKIAKYLNRLSRGGHSMYSRALPAHGRRGTRRGGPGERKDLPEGEFGGAGGAGWRAPVVPQQRGAQGALEGDAN